jgi:hypothetical protein
MAASFLSNATGRGERLYCGEKGGTNAAGDQSPLWAAVNSKALLELSRSPGL